MSDRKFQFANSVVFWIVLGFIVWIISFWGFLSSKLALSEDALSYYSHIKFFVHSISKGIFPLWDPFWCNGAPNDFFLRRFGAFNPFYSIIIILEIFKIPYNIAYLCFLALYYWSGMITFYLLAKRLLNSTLIAYAGYLILLFSALGTRLFDSYMMLITVPVIWFFYFLVAFTQNPRKLFFLGTALSFMILSSTYIPFYFLLFLSVFVPLFMIFYFDQLKSIGQAYIGFIKKNKALVLMVLVTLSLTFVPLLMFSQDSASGKIVLPTRHGNALEGHALIVPYSTLGWGAPEDLYYSSYFSNLKTYKFAILYIPFFAVIVFALGIFCRVSRLAMFLFVTGFVLSCCIVPYGLPFYEFLYKHVFFLKYFRNLHFFIWFILISLFVLLVLEHWKMLKIEEESKRNRLWYIWTIHVGVFLFVFLRHDAIVTTYIMIALSALFWSLLSLGYLRSNILKYGLLSAVILVQPLEVYHYLKKTATLYHPNTYDYDFSLSKPILVQDLQSSDETKSSLYYATASYDQLYHSVSNRALDAYLGAKLFLVDHLFVINKDQMDFVNLQNIFLNDLDAAVISLQGQAIPKLKGNDYSNPLRAQRLLTEGANFKVLSFNANNLKVLVNIPYEKFLVYNDGYDPHWKATINGRSVPIYQTNFAFKGVWLSAGENIVEFRYVSLKTYLLNALLLLMGFVLLGGMFWSLRRKD